MQRGSSATLSEGSWAIATKPTDQALEDGRVCSRRERERGRRQRSLVSRCRRGSYGRETRGRETAYPWSTAGYLYGLPSPERACYERVKMRVQDSKAVRARPAAAPVAAAAAAAPLLLLLLAGGQATSSPSTAALAPSGPPSAQAALVFEPGPVELPAARTAACSRCRRWEVRLLTSQPQSCCSAAVDQLACSTSPAASWPASASNDVESRLVLTSLWPSDRLPS
jgi:hypothetical protein